MDIVQDKMYGIERKAEIINLLEQSGKVDVNELSGRFKSSRETIRRDLRDLEKDGILKRTHGGAVFNSSHVSSVNEYPVAIREIQRFAEKNAICKKAASFIRDGDIIFADNSSTCIFLMKYIPADIHVTLVTNSLKLLFESAANMSPNHLVVCLGGLFHGSNLSLYGNIALKNAHEYYPGKAFMSCAGIHPQNQLADSSVLEVDTKRLMIERSQQVFILADYSKFEKVGQIHLTDFSSVDYVITDNKVHEEDVAFLDKQGIHVVIAGQD
jgi:DeoR family transcriptional regulator, fructose operon transcriptional repressor